MLTKPIDQWQGDYDELDKEVKLVEKRLELLDNAILIYGVAATDAAVIDDDIASELEDHGWDPEVALGVQRSHDEAELTSLQDRQNNLAIALDHYDGWR